jgi:hypothetical protein
MITNICILLIVDPDAEPGMSVADIIAGGCLSTHIHRTLLTCELGMRVMKEHQRSLFDQGILTLQPALTGKNLNSLLNSLCLCVLTMK